MTLFPGPNVPRIKTSAPLYRGCISLLFLLSHSLSLSFRCVTKASLYVSFISSLLIVRDRRGAAVKLAGNKKKKQLVLASLWHKNQPTDQQQHIKFFINQQRRTQESAVVFYKSKSPRRVNRIKSVFSRCVCKEENFAKENKSTRFGC